MDNDETYNGWPNWETWNAYTLLTSYEDEMLFLELTCGYKERSEAKMILAGYFNHVFLAKYAVHRPGMAASAQRKVNWERIIDVVNEA